MAFPYLFGYFLGLPAGIEKTRKNICSNANNKGSEVGENFDGKKFFFHGEKGLKGWGRSPPPG